jgi:hypothetical protein
MVDRFIADLEQPIPRVRLENYRPPQGDNLAMIVTYFHNLELSEALYPTLQAFEISLRNSIHATLSDHFQTPYWFDIPELFPNPAPPKSQNRQRMAIKGARASLSKNGKDHTPDRIVAELHLGFWHSMFNAGFEANLWRPNQSALIEKVFPLSTRKQRNRQAMWDRIDKIRIIRNRVMHYEPIWYRPRLPEDHAAILEALNWISPAMHRTIAMCDRFPLVLASGYASMELKVHSEIENWLAPHRCGKDRA